MLETENSKVASHITKLAKLLQTKWCANYVVEGMHRRFSKLIKILCRL